MADIDASEIDLRDNLRPQHLQQASDLFSGDTQDSFNALDQTSAKTSVNSAQATLIDNFESTTDTQVTSAKSAKDSTVDSFETANDTLIGTAKTNIDTLLATFKDEYPFASEAAFDALVDTLNSDIDSEIDTTIAPDYTTHKSDLATDIDTVAPDYTTLKSDLATEVNDGFDTTVTCNKSDVFDEAKTQLETAIAAIQSGGTDKFPYSCIRCGGVGFYAASNDDENVTTLKKCNSCDGMGRTETQNIPVNGVFPVTYSPPRE